MRLMASLCTWDLGMKMGAHSSRDERARTCALLIILRKARGLELKDAGRTSASLLVAASGAPGPKLGGSQVRVTSVIQLSPGLSALRAILSFNAQLKKFHSTCRKSSLFSLQFPHPMCFQESPRNTHLFHRSILVVPGASACCLATNL